MVTMQSIWPFRRSKPSAEVRERCLHGSLHVWLYLCPDCNVLHITTNRTRSETLAMLRQAADDLEDYPTLITEKAAGAG